jgi:hypothetical protein
MGDAAEGDRRDLGRIRSVCSAFPECDEHELQGRPLFRVRTRRFAIFNGATSPRRPRWDAFGRSLHFVTDPHERESLMQDAGFRLSPHHGDRGWLVLDLTGEGVDWTEVAELLETAYRQVAGRQLIEELDSRQNTVVGRAGESHDASASPHRGLG